MKLPVPDITLTECIIIVVIVGLLAAMGTGIVRNHQKRPAMYAVWVKQTGNPKQLTFEEWKLWLQMEQMEQEKNQQIVPVVVPIPTR